MTGEGIVIVCLRCVEVDISLGKIGIALVKQGLHHLDECIDAACRGDDNLRLLYIELVAVGEECVGIIFCYLEHGFMLALCALEHFVFASVAVA